MKVDLGVYELGDFGSSSSSDDDDRLLFDEGKIESFDGFRLSDEEEVGDEGDLGALELFNGAGMRMQFWWKDPCTVSVS